MSRHYKTLTSFTFEHEYYADAICGDLNLQPTSDTASLLPKYRLAFGTIHKKRPGSYQVLREYVDDTTPLIALPDNYLLRFEMYQTNAAFINFTEIPAPESREIYFFENQASGSNAIMGASYRKMEVVWDAVQLTDLPAAADVTVTPADGSPAWLVTGYDENGVRKARIILEDKANGVYTLTWPSGGFKEVYRDGQLMGKGLFGILHLKVATGSLEVNANGYLHEFAAKITKWQYFLMIRNAVDPDDYSIANGNPGGNGVFSFTKYPAGAWGPGTAAYIAQLASMSNGADVRAFISDNDIAYRDVARSSIKLLRGIPPSDVTVIKDLPNPGAGAANPGVLVLVDEPI